MQGLTQWGALEVLAHQSDDAFAALLDVPASWWVDADGVAHGKPEHALDASGSSVPPTRGTLRDLCTAPRHSKACMSVARAGGDRAVEAAALAQRLTEGLHGFDQLPGLCDTDPVAAAMLAATLLDRLPQTQDPGLARVVAGCRQAAEESRRAAIARCRDPQSRRALIAAAVESICLTHPASPVEQIRAAVQEEVGGWRVVSALMRVPVDDAWAASVRQEIAAVTPRSLSALDSLDPPQVAAVVASVAEGAGLREAAVHAWRDRLLDLASAAPAWAAAYAEQAARGVQQLAVVCGSPSAWDAYSPAVRLAWSDDTTSGVFVVPRVVAESVARISPAFRCAPVPRALDTRELETLTTLVTDAGWAPEDLAGLVAAAQALR